MNRTLSLTLLIITLAASAVFYGLGRTRNLAQINEPIVEATKANLLPISPYKTQGNFNLIEPVAGFSEHITKKTFGLYITPDTSPVENDKFTGYHTGVDSEFTETIEEIPVRAIADGTIVVRKWSTGYGGVIVIKHLINDIPVFVVYGHLDVTSFPVSSIVQVKAGDQIAVLGDDHSEETDGVRKHLHLSIYAGEKLDMRGYVQTQEELSNWLNPLNFY